MDEDGEHISTTKARAGTTPHVARYALGGWLLPLFGWWVDRHRVVPARADAVDVARAT